MFKVVIDKIVASKHGCTHEDNFKGIIRQDIFKIPT